MSDDSEEILLQPFLQKTPREHFWHGRGCPLFDVIHPAFPQLAMASPTLQGPLKNGFGEAVEACDMPKPCKFPSLDSCQKRFLWTHKEVDPALHPIAGLHCLMVICCTILYLNCSLLLSPHEDDPELAVLVSLPSPSTLSAAPTPSPLAVSYTHLTLPTIMVV